MPLHVFVAMPFGIKDGVDFNRVYAELIRPAIEGEGLVVSVSYTHLTLPTNREV